MSTVGSSPTPVVQRLKSERVQEMLAAMPDWTLQAEGESITRVYEFPSARVARNFAHFAQAFAQEEGHALIVDLAKTEVDLTLTGPMVRGRFGDLTEEIVEFARKLG
jgi:pterin-4a-carbinolamine dehydratase